MGRLVKKGDAPTKGQGNLLGFLGRVRWRGRTPTRVERARRRPASFEVRLRLVRRLPVRRSRGGKSSRPRPMRRRIPLPRRMTPLILRRPSPSAPRCAWRTRAHRARHQRLGTSLRVARARSRRPSRARRRPRPTPHRRHLHPPRRCLRPPPPRPRRLASRAPLRARRPRRRARFSAMLASQPRGASSGPPPRRSATRNDASWPPRTPSPSNVSRRWARASSRAIRTRALPPSRGIPSASVSFDASGRRASPAAEASPRSSPPTRSARPEDGCTNLCSRAAD